MARQFSQTLLERIRQANDIVSLVSEHVQLEKRGQSYWGCCPFHNEKTPSFTVNPDKGLFHCFGCKAGGNVFSFVQQYNNISFPEAVELLADRAGIELPKREMSKAERAREEERKELYEVLDLASHFFHNCLRKTKMGQRGLEYLHKRGLSDETIDTFRLGFAPDNWDKLYRAFTKRSISTDILLKSGLCRQSKGKVYDYFRDRVMFPIFDGRGRVVAFGGRVLGDKEPKYLNSPETSLFNKRRLLFGFDKAYKSIRQKRQVILVEGYMDVVSLFNKGVENVVASLGTAFTKEQSQLLLRQVDEVILAYDMDAAGRQASDRAVEILQNQEYSTAILTLPQGKDPDEFIKTQGVEAFMKRVEEAEDPFTYLLNEALQKHDSNRFDGKLALLHDVFPYIERMRDPLKQEALLTSLAMPLWLEEKTIQEYYQKYKQKNLSSDTVQDGAPPVQTGLLSKDKEEQLGGMALQNPQVLGALFQYLAEEEFQSQLLYRVLKKGKEWMEDHEQLDSSFEESLEKEEKNEYYRLLMIVQDYDEHLFNQNIRLLHLEYLREAYKKHSAKADALSRAGDSQFVEELQLCQQIQDEIKAWTI